MTSCEPQLCKLCVCGYFVPRVQRSLMATWIVRCPKFALICICDVWRQVSIVCGVQIVNRFLGKYSTTMCLIFVVFVKVLFTPYAFLDLMVTGLTRVGFCANRQPVPIVCWCFDTNLNIGKYLNNGCTEINLKQHRSLKRFSSKLSYGFGLLKNAYFYSYWNELFTTWR